MTSGPGTTPKRRITKRGTTKKRTKSQEKAYKDEKEPAEKEHKGDSMGLVKTVGLSTGFGLLLSLVIIYLLDGLNGGAVGVVVLLCLAFTNGLGQLLGWIFGKRK